MFAEWSGKYAPHYVLLLFSIRTFSVVVKNAIYRKALIFVEDEIFPIITNNLSLI